MLSVNFSLFVTLFLLTIRGVSCEELTPVKNEEFALEDSSVTLSYKYSKKANVGDYFFWYRQYPGKPPGLLISHSASGAVGNDPIPGLSVTVSDDKTQMDLQIISAKVTDSAVYYCALQPNAGGGTKIIFGSGTRLNIEPKDEFEPSYYKLKDGNNTEACLATGFSRQNATKLDPKNEGLFNNSEAVLISEEPLDGLFNQVALLNSTSEGKCQETDGDGLCEETLELDPTVNGITLTITILRLMFFKTVVFNIVMSLRLWISQ